MNREFDHLLIDGFLAIGLWLVLAASAVMGMVSGSVVLIVLGIVLALVLLVCLAGFGTIEPNQNEVAIWFGEYAGTIDRVGFFWVNPFYARKKISMRINNLDVEPIKVNDRVGNPVMIGLVLVWRVDDPYRVTFDLNTGGGQTVQSFVAVQSDAALREVAGRYPYDDTHDHEGLTLRSGGEEINDELEQKLNERLSIAGIRVVEARLNYLAYAPEIAAVMLRRQQAAAIVSAREQIVEGAVSMVEMSVQRFDANGTLHLTEADKARMAANLMVVLCADEAATPVLDAGN